MPGSVTWQLKDAGPLQVLRHGAVVAHGTRKALALLAILVLDGPQPRAKLAAWLWPDTSPPAARRNLRREVHRWRSLGLPLVDLDGDRLSAPEVALDLAESTDPESFMQGLDGVGAEAFQDWLEQRRARLAARHKAGEGKTDVHRTSIDKTGVRMPAAHAPLVDSPASHASSWAASPIAAAAVQAPARNAAVVPALPAYVPRTDVEQGIEQAWSAHRCAYLAGEPGAGKTRLAIELAARHGPLLRLAARPDDAGLPYAAWRRALQQLGVGTAEAALPAWVQDALSALLPPLDTDRSAQTASAAADDQRLPLAIAEAIRRLCTGDFGVLLFDDWQWADPASAQVWLSLDAQSMPGLQRLALFRSGELPPALLARVRAEVDAGRARWLALPAMSGALLQHMLERMAGGPAPELARQLQAACGGNPFFALESLRWLAARGELWAEADGHWSSRLDMATDSGAVLPIPPRVRDAVVARAHALGPQVALVLQAAALDHADIDSARLAAVLELPAADAVHALEHARAAGLLLPDTDRLRLSHDLVRQALIDGLTPARRQWLHRALARAWAERGDAPERVAWHWDLAGDPVAARPWHQRAADAAWRLHVRDAAMRHWQAVLDSRPPPAEAVLTRLSMARCLARSDAADAADALLRTAATDAADPELAARVRHAQVELRLQAGRLDDARLLLADDIGGPPWPPARRLQLLAQLAIREGRLDQATEHAAAAARGLRAEPEDVVTLAAVHETLARAALQRSQLDLAQRACDTARALLATVDAPAALASVQVVAGAMLMSRDRRAEAVTTLEDACRLARLGGHAHAQRMALLNLIKLHTDSGRLDAAEAALNELDTLPPSPDPARGRLLAGQARWYLHWLRGELARCDALLPQLLADAAQVQDAYARLATLQMVVDRPLCAGQLDAADALLCQAEQDRSLVDGRLNAAMIGLKRVRWLTLAGRHELALRKLQELPPPARDEERLLHAALGARALRQLGQPEQAGQWLARAGADEHGSGDALALWLTEALYLQPAASGGVPDAGSPGLAERAHRLLESPQVPMAERQALQAALKAAASAAGGAATADALPIQRAFNAPPLRS